MLARRTARPRAERARGERGAVTVEAALVTPLLLLLIFGMVELSLLLRDYVAVTSAVRTGARMASTAAGAGPGTCLNLPDAPTCTPATSPALAQLAADAIQSAGSGMPKDAINYVLVYKANDKGYPGANGSTTIPTSCAGIANCVRYTWRDAQDKFRFADGSWDSRQISACFPGDSRQPLEAVGVAMVADHTFLTGMFGRTMRLTQRTSMNFEPLETDHCAAGQHI